MVNFEQNLAVQSWAQTGPLFPQVLIGPVDTAGYDRFMIDVTHGPVNNTGTTAKFGWLRLYQGEEPGPVSSMTAIDGWIGTTNSTATSSQFVLPTSNNDEMGTTIRFMSSTAPFARYIGVELAVPSAAGSAIIRLCRGVSERAGTWHEGGTGDGFVPEEMTTTIESIRLNIGAGDQTIEGFTPIDRSLGTEAYPLEAYEDSSVEEIRASHVLEHFSHADVPKVLMEWIRVLKPGGRLRLAVPDFEWIARHYGNGVSDRMLFGYTYGGQTDENDFHKSGYDETRLREIMQAVGLVDVKRWKPDQQDCSALPVSLNLEGTKAVPVESPVIEAIMSMPRLAHTANWWCCERVLAPRGIPITHVTGAFWGQCLERGMASMIDRDDPPGFVLTLDYDTVFDGAMLDELVRLMCTNDVDAVAPWQMKREGEGPLAWFTDADGNARQRISLEEFDQPLVDVNTAHFGLTLIRTEALRRMEHPWFMSKPGDGGRWENGRIDEDIGFWNAFKAAGNRLCMAGHVGIGHIEQMITWPSNDLKPIYQHIEDFRKVGRPKGARL